MSSADTTLVLNAVIMAVTDGVPRLLMLEHHEHAPAHEGPALPFGPFEPDRHRTLEIALRGWIEEQAGLPVDYVEQLYTFGDRNRDPSERAADFEGIWSNFPTAPSLPSPATACRIVAAKDIAEGYHRRLG